MCLHLLAKLDSSTETCGKVDTTYYGVVPLPFGPPRSLSVVRGCPWPQEWEICGLSIFYLGRTQLLSAPDRILGSIHLLPQWDCQSRLPWSGAKEQIPAPKSVNATPSSKTLTSECVKQSKQKPKKGKKREWGRERDGGRKGERKVRGKEKTRISSLAFETRVSRSVASPYLFQLMSCFA